MKDLFRKYKSYKKAFHLEKLRQDCIKYAHGDVLEICSGLGVDFDYYDHDKVLSVTVVDKNLEYLNFSKEIVKKDVFNKFAFKNDDALSFINNAEGRYDCIVLPLCLCAFDDPVLLVEKAIKILKGDGLIISFQHGSSRLSILRKIQRKLDFIYKKIFGCHVAGDYNEIFAKDSYMQPVVTYKKHAGIFHVAIYKKSPDPRT